MGHINHFELGDHVKNAPEKQRCPHTGFKTVLDIPWRGTHASSCVFLFASAGMPEEMNLSDVKRIHQTDGGGTLDTTGAGCTTATESLAFTLMGAVMLLPGLW